MCVKRNQKTLYEGIADQMGQTSPSDLCFSSERAHSRHEHRLVMAYEPDHTWQDRWPGLSRILGVYRCGQRNNHPYAECHYYISDLSLEVDQFAQLIRGHWSIENTLHWPKDVVLGEDTARQRAGNSPANWSLVRNIFINLARHCGFASMAKAKRFFANQPRDVLLALT